MSSKESQFNYEFPLENQNDDEVADMMEQIILSEKGSVVMEKTMNDIERSCMVETTQSLGRHVPACVMAQLTCETLRLAETEESTCSSKAKYGFPMSSHSKASIPMEMPHATQYEAALLFVDMSGFTKISQKLDVESLSKAINSYFQAIVDEITSHGSDILKFAGDAIFAEWRSSKNKPLQEKKQARHKMMTLQKLKTKFAKGLLPITELDDCVHTAAICGASIVKKCADYPVYAKTISGVQGNIIATLNMHCGLGVGEMVGVHVGNNYSRREYLVFGDPIDQVAEACDSAKLGEIRASESALKRLNRSQPFKYQMKCDKGKKSVVIASGKRAFFCCKKCKASPQKSTSLGGGGEKIDISFDKMDTTSIKFLQKLLSFYVHPVVAADEDVESPLNQNLRHSNKESMRGSRRGSQISRRASQISRRSSTISTDAKERYRSEAELRSVFTIFIMPKIEARLTNDPVKNQKTFQLLNDIMNVVTSILHNYKGHLRQYIVDDKGVVLIATFGLRGSTFPNMVSERALPTCRLINATLESELGVDNQIGATLGKVYCGIVGGVERHEFAVLGPSVNLSARLMAQKNHPGVLVDNEVRLKAKKLNFIKFPSVKAKGYVDLVPVFKPLTAKETRWGKVNAKYVGRKKEMETVCSLAVEMSRAECKSNMFFLWGESGAGKSSFVVHTIVRVRKELFLKKKRPIITRNVCCECDTLVPFSVFRSIFRDVLSEKPIDDEASFASRGTNSLFGKGWDNKSFSTMSTNDCETTSVISRLHEICEELNAPEGFLGIVGHHLLGNSNLKMASVKKAPELDDIVAFMAEVFIRSTRHAEVIILALDDVQWMDNLSWKVVRNIFERSTNVLIVCCSRLIEDIPLTMDKDFWEMLNGKYRDSNLYYETYIGALEKSEVREMAALTLKCKPEDISDKYINDVYMHSGGMPYFASEILESCLRKNLCKRNADNKIGWRQHRRNSQEGLHYTNLNELLLLRIDNLDDLTRKALHFASVLGASFELQEIVEISGHILCIPEEEKEQHSLAIKTSLEAAVEEGILDVTVQDESDVDEEHSKISMMMIKVDCSDGQIHKYLPRRKYSFYHSTWRRLILSMLLDSWKRDIHKHAAMAIEARSPDPETRDYRTKVKLFQHWKDSEDTLKAADFALDIGQSFKMLGLNLHSIKIYDDALEMWRKHKPSKSEDTIGGFAPDVLDSLDEGNLVYLIKLLTMFGQAVGSTSKRIDQNRSARTFEDALNILRFSPASAQIKDRAFIFPIYSGMFFLLKYKVDVSYSEEDLIKNFVQETKMHGDPVHYGRALAMQGETYHRNGHFDNAIKSHIELKQVYDVDKHHSLVVASYASDRLGQNFGCTANCYMRLGQTGKAMEVVYTIINKLMPKMDPKNVHNSIATIYPAIWILKDNGKSDEARAIFVKYVLEPFREFYGEDGATPFKPSFRGLEALLDIVLYMEGVESDLNGSYSEWALDLHNLDVPMGLEIAIGTFGRSPMSINAEVCLRLSKLSDDPEIKARLLENGIIVAERALSGCDGSDGSSRLLTTYCQIKPVYDELKKLSE